MRATAAKPTPYQPYITNDGDDDEGQRQVSTITRDNNEEAGMPSTTMMQGQAPSNDE